MDQDTELSHLHKAEVDLAEARIRIKRQEELIARLDKDGHDVAMATTMLDTMRQTLKAMEDHRQLILKELSAEKKRPTW